MLKLISGLILSILLISPAELRAEDYTPPKDGAYTESQLTNAINVTKEWMETLTTAGKAVDGSKSTAVILATMAHTDQKFKDSLAKHNLTESEYDWITKQMWDAYGTLIQVDTFGGDKSKKDFADQLKTNTDALATANKNLADHQAAQKSGKRILPADERASIIDNAKSDEQSAADDLKSHTGEIKQANDDIAKAKSDQSEVEKLAKNPPSDVGADDKDQYVKDRQADADAAKQAIKDVTDRLNQANDAKKASEAQIAADKSKEQNPDMPVTDDEKAAAKKDIEDAINADKEQIDQQTAAIQTLKESQATAQKLAADAATKSPAQNVDLLKKHRQDVEAIFIPKTGAK